MWQYSTHRRKAASPYHSAHCSRIFSVYGIKPLVFTCCFNQHHIVSYDDVILKAVPHLSQKSTTRKSWISPCFGFKRKLSYIRKQEVYEACVLTIGDQYIHVCLKYYDAQYQPFPKKIRQHRQKNQMSGNSVLASESLHMGNDTWSTVNTNCGIFL